MDRYRDLVNTPAFFGLLPPVNGLIIEAVAEPCADEQTAAAHPQVADTRIAPYFLIVRARKP